MSEQGREREIETGSQTDRGSEGVGRIPSFTGNQ